MTKTHALITAARPAATRTLCGRELANLETVDYQQSAAITCGPCKTIAQGVESTPVDTTGGSSCTATSRSGLICDDQEEHDAEGMHTAWDTAATQRRNWIGDKSTAQPARRAMDTRHLATLVDRLGSNTRPDDQLDNLTSILELAEKMRALAVDQARADGLSWSKIGEELGLTRQAAQQRYGKKPTGPAPERETTLPGL